MQQAWVVWFCTMHIHKTPKVWFLDSNTLQKNMTNKNYVGK